MQLNGIYCFCLSFRYVLAEQERKINLECVSASDRHELNTNNTEVKQIEGGTEDGPSAKRQKLSKRAIKKLKGQNKSRGPTFHIKKEQELCNSLIIVAEGEEIPKCNRSNCRFLHDIQEYLTIKPKDIGDTCYNYQISGKCSRGLACRFGNGHITPEGKNRIDKEKIQIFESQGSRTKNQLLYDLQTSLRKRNYNFDLSEALIRYNDKMRKEKVCLLRTK